MTNSKFSETIKDQTVGGKNKKNWVVEINFNHLLWRVESELARKGLSDIFWVYVSLPTFQYREIKKAESLWDQELFPVLRQLENITNTNIQNTANHNAPYFFS